MLHWGQTNLTSSLRTRALLKHPHLGHNNLTCFLGTRPFWSINTWDRPTLLVPLGRGSSGASTLGIDQLDWFPWDEAFLEHRHLGQTNLTCSLGTRLFWSIDTWDRPTCFFGTGLFWSIDTW